MRHLCKGGAVKRWPLRSLVTALVVAVTLVAPRTPFLAGAAPTSVAASVAFVNAAKPNVIAPCPKYALAAFQTSRRLQATLARCQGEVYLHTTYPNASFATYYRGWGHALVTYANALDANLAHPHRVAAAVITHDQEASLAFVRGHFGFLARWVAATPAVLAHVEQLRPFASPTLGLGMFWFATHDGNISCQLESLLHGGRIATTSNLYCDVLSANRHVTMTGAGVTTTATGNSNGPLDQAPLPSSGVVGDDAIRCTFTADAIRCTVPGGHGFSASRHGISTFTHA